ncbi:butyrate kinase [Peptostreptococcus canis]|uniref:Probable butyrate kinase n=1 Tax=Peptostreptococcus canis TaxID=1159213 RepID=A0ABR6TLL9_9FIRM|nr:butyrate kinase [Peptostreptococcus canis]MBC2576128.1 butyrate kinase [Peptostreptococcus canis]MBP1998339.1 butyrate kinase [Peptostreptococcus canis]
MKILIINPGSTSTKVGIYEDLEEKIIENITISAEELSRFNDLYEQTDMRYEQVIEFLNRNNLEAKDIDVIVSRGGMLPPLHAGAYVIDDNLCDIMRNRPAQLHASNLGALVAKKVSDLADIPAYIYDAVSVDELTDVARLSGVKKYPRRSFSHALNTRAVAMRFCKDHDMDYYNSNIIVAHLGGGISLNFQKNGHLVDISSSDEGPFSTNRAGFLPIYSCITIAKEEGHEGLQRYEDSTGGLVSYLNTNDAREVEKMITDGDKEAELVYKGMAYQIAKTIGSLSVIDNGKVDGIILTGGIAYSKMLTQWIVDKVSFIAPVSIYPGEFEMKALAQGGYRVMMGEEKADYLR